MILKKNLHINNSNNKQIKIEEKRYPPSLAMLGIRSKHCFKIQKGPENLFINKYDQ